MARWFSIKPGITMKGRKFKGLRGWAGKPFHPPLTDIPIAAYILGAIFDVLSYLLRNRVDTLDVIGSGELSHMDFISTLSHDLWRAGTFLFIAGLIVSVPTALTGFWDWWKSMTPHTQAWRTANWHMAVMLTTTALVVVDILMRWKTDQVMYTDVPIMILSVVIAGLVSLGATYGGSLVYDYGFNVETAGDHPVWHESEKDVFPGEDKAID